MITRRPFFILVSVNATRGADCAASVAAPASAATSASPSRWKWRGIGQPPSEVTAQIIGTTRIVGFLCDDQCDEIGKGRKRDRVAFYGLRKKRPGPFLRQPAQCPFRNSTLLNPRA